MDLVTILGAAVQQGASDIHICAGKPPMMRLNGQIMPVNASLAPLKAEETKLLVYSALYDEQRAKFEENWELDSSFAVKGVSRFRLNVLITRGGVDAVMRVIPSIIPTPEQLGLQPTIVNLSTLPKGLVLVTGPTGSGKSTTLAAILDLINQKKKGHILTIEDPIEFTYESKECIVRQREIGQHTKSFNNALRAALREDPNVILVGEMRDLETIQLTITAAETGHLTFATLHTQDAPSTIDRIIDVFPPHQQTQVRVQLAASLQAVVSQLLLPRMDGKGRVAVREIMVMTPAIANLIREGKTHMIYSAIETGAKFGMIPMDKALSNLVAQKLISFESAVAKAHDQEMFKKLCGMAGGL
ncbi:MAG: type IV pili twitching motility protein PilT [Elusimicrobia bacterium GWC2_51_8]|nr:MAG: type IV pili twitching motility protein PilT [Elusimicrobia bacterium GWA2_51_34]OGR60507.1 MAG: type IV pili twitching motility protein PilT [Elusimicrobia bacterium GWC2_51_8]OGR85145.1 MAG: type IV pili twitching motility protein PilT [Elusimicrobia bacterium GWF2_52_66]HAF94516.1 type IV pili twitching motility protein PilT [Elusimicrobiota bacterium]HCE97918.1 type IV pili twitching motility protein PilT [Elusimicrobiota bacterium]